MGFTDWLFSLGRVVDTKLGATKRGIMVRLNLLEGNSGDAPEQSGWEPMLGPPGFFCRPKKPGTGTPLDPTGSCEAVALRLGDDVVPLGFKDLRLSSNVNPKEGELGLCQYQGGFVSLKDNADGDGTDLMLYALRRKANGDPDKASCISLDSTAGNAHLALMHEYGQTVTLTKTGDIILANKAGDAFVQVKDGGLVLNGANIALAGGAMLGDKDPSAGDFVALAALVLSELGKIATALNSHTHTAPTGGGATTSPTGAPLYTASSVAATMVKAK